MFRFLTKIFHSQLLKFRFVKELYDFKKQYEANCNTYPGHFYSPIIDKQEIVKRKKQFWPDELPSEISGIHLNLSQQFEWINILNAYYPEIPYVEQPTEGKRYYYENEYYSYTDAITLYSFFKKLNPKKVIEIGSGFSSAAMLDARDQLQYNTQFTFIDPYPERLRSVLFTSDIHNTHIISKQIQDIPLEFFDSLEVNDILFIDSSHVMKTGSDVHQNLFAIIPRLKSGVYIHFHDIFYPFEYPTNWIMNGTNWNELYALRAFLMYNEFYSMQFFSHYLHTMHESKFEQAPKTRKNYGGNLWLKKK